MSGMPSSCTEDEIEREASGIVAKYQEQEMTHTSSAGKKDCPPAPRVSSKRAYLNTPHPRAPPTTMPAITSAIHDREGTCVPSGQLVR